MFIRTCQECGFLHKDTAPEYGKEPSDSYKFRKCKRCKSESLDYGSDVPAIEVGNKIVRIEETENE